MRQMNKIIKWGLIALVGLIVLAIMTPEPKVIYKDRECNCKTEKEVIGLYKEVLKLDNEAFILTGNALQDPFNSYAMSKATERVNEIVVEKNLKLSEIVTLEKNLTNK